MSNTRVRRRVEEEARAEEPWDLEDYDWDPLSCIAHKKRIVASDNGTSATNILSTALQQALQDSALSNHISTQQTLPENPHFEVLPVLDFVERNDAEPATACEVIGCGASLEGLKRYYVRMRVCAKHLHAPSIVVNGVVSRFCQQCAKFQFVGNFSGGKKSCTATLERHNARHRAKVLARIQDINDGDSDSMPTGGKGSGRARSKLPTGRRRRAAGQTPAAIAVGRTCSGSASASTAALMATERSGSDTLKAAFINPSWVPSTSAVNGFNLGGFGSQAVGPHAFTTVQVQTHMSANPGPPVLSAEAATTPSKAASPHILSWDGASSAPLDLPPRPLVTTGVHGVVVTAEPGTMPLPGLTITQHPQPQQQQQVAPMASSLQYGTESLHAFTWQQPQRHYPYDVQNALTAVQDQFVISHTAHSKFPQICDMEAAAAAADKLHVAERIRNHGEAVAWHAHHAAAGGSDVLASRSHAAATGAWSDGSAPSVSNAQYTSNSDCNGKLMSSGRDPQGMVRHAVQATATGHVGGGGSGLEIPTATRSGRNRYSEQEPCGSSGRVSTHAPSPSYSTDEGVSATRVSFSGAGLAVKSGSIGDSDAQPLPQPEGDVAARISSIMHELCPLLQQLKQGLGHGSAVLQESTADCAEAATAAAAFDATAASRGSESGVGAPSGSSPLDTVLAMMHQASQLAASLQQSRSFTSNPGPWTVTSGTSPGRLPSLPLTEASDNVPRPQGSGPISRPGHSTSLPAAAAHSPISQLAMRPAPGWRPLASNPAVVVNEVAVQHMVAASTSLSAVGAMSGCVGGMRGPLWAPKTHLAPGVSVSGHVEGGALPHSPRDAEANSEKAPVGFGTGSQGATAIPVQQQLLQQTTPASSSAVGFLNGSASTLVSAPVADSTGDDSDDDMFQQLLTLLQDDSGEGHAIADQQQQFFHGIASTAQYAVANHQQIVHSLPYGHEPMSPFYWPPASMQPPTHHPYPLPASQTHHTQPLHIQGHQPTPTPFAWASPPSPQMQSGSLPMAMANPYVIEADDVDPRELTRVSLKAMNVLPHELPSNLRSNLRRWLKEARAEALHATLRPGCLQLVVDVLRAPSAATAVGELSALLLPTNDADQAAADVFRVLGQRLRDIYVQVDRKVLQMRVGERPVVLSWETAANEGGLDDAKYPELKACSVVAVCAGSEAVLQLQGDQLHHPALKVFARVRGRDLRTELLLPDLHTAIAGSSSGRDRLGMSVAVPAGSIGLMALEVGVGHLLGDWWPVLVLPRGCTGAVEELRQLQTDVEALHQQGPAASAAANNRALQRLITDMAGVLEVFADTVAADTSATAAAASATVTSTSMAGTWSSSGGGSGDAVLHRGARSPAEEGRCSSPSVGAASQVSARSDASLSAVSAGGWSSGTMLSTNAGGSTLGSFMTTSSALPSITQTPTGQHAGQLATGAALGRTAAAVGAAAGCSGAGATAGSPARVVILPQPSATAMRQALQRAARLLRYAVARGLPHMTALLLTIAVRLARMPDQRQAAQQTAVAATAPQPPIGHVELLVAAGLDLQALLPLAVLSGSAPTVHHLMSFSVEVVGSPLQLDLPQGPGGLTPLHLAALLPDGGALACHLLGTQPWAAWEWLTLHWTPPELLKLVADKAKNAASSAPGDQGHKATTSAASGDATVVRGLGDSQGERGTGDTVKDDDRDEEVEQEEVVRLTPGSLSFLLGNGMTVRKAVSMMVAPLGRGAASVDSPASKAMVEALDAWGRTGVVLLEALCAQLAQQKLQ